MAQEHLATAIAQSLMSYGLMKSPLPAANGRRVLLACVEANQHAPGLQMVSDAFQLAGWETQFLRADVPTRALMQQIAQFRPELLALSVSFAQQLNVVKQIVAQLIEVHGKARPAVIVGGLALNQFRPLAATLGADAWSPHAAAAPGGAGDRVLMRLGGLLREQTRAHDVVARFGGEEFLVLLPHTGLAQAAAKADLLRSALAAELIAPLPRRPTASFGVAELAPGEDGPALLQRVDAALYRAKEGGRNRVVVAEAP